MKAEQIYQQLQEIAEKLGINVREQNLRKTGIPVRSGLCKVKGQLVFIMDKHLAVHRKNQALAECLTDFSLEELYIVPAVRQFLEHHQRIQQGR